MNTLVNFELAKLLKEKGFDAIDCSGYYHICDGYTKGYAHCYSDVNTQQETAILAPTIAEVVMWLYEKHGIWVSVTTQVTSEFQMVFTVFKASIKLVFHSNPYKPYNSPTEAYEAAIEYTLNNLV